MTLHKPEIGSAIALTASIHPSAHIGLFSSIENNVKIGLNAHISNGVSICQGTVIGDRVYIGANTTFTSPIRKQKITGNNQSIDCIQVENDCLIGAAVTILPGIILGKFSQIESGSVVTRSVPPYAIVSGSPAKIVGYAGNEARHPKYPEKLNDSSAVEIKVLGKIYTLDFFPDLRGNLFVAEFQNQIPFTPKRFFMISDVPNSKIRGEHAHLECKQFLICVRGSCLVSLDNNKMQDEVLLNRPNIGLYIPPMIWASQLMYSDDAILLVFASDHYDNSDYIRNYEDFKKIVDSNK